MQVMTIAEAFAHAGSLGMNETEERARATMPGRMFYHREKKQRLGYCTKCHSENIRLSATPAFAAHDTYVDPEEFDGYDLREHPEAAEGLLGPDVRWRTNGLLDGQTRHGHWGWCPCCGALVQYRAWGRGRSTVYDRAFLIRYKRSEVEPGALVMLGWQIYEEWANWDEYNEPEPQFDLTLEEICVFRPGKGGERFVREDRYFADYNANTQMAENVRWERQWVRRQKCVGGYDPSRGPFGRGGSYFFLDMDSMDAALAKHPFARAAAAIREVEDEYGNNCLDMIRQFNFVFRYPACEYLCKLGMEGLLKKQFERPADDLLNMRGRTAEKVLRIEGDTWGWIKGHKELCTPRFLKIWRFLRRKGVRIGCGIAAELARREEPGTIRKIIDALPAGKEAAAIRYLAGRHAGGIDYFDYLSQMEELGMDKRDRSLLFPRDFERMHRELSLRIKTEADRQTDEKIARRQAELSDYWFSAYGLTLRPMLSAGEIIREGTALRHCVGGYVKAYAEGRTILLALRREEAPAVPWRTVEFAMDGHKVQDRGYSNDRGGIPDGLSEQLNRFWALFEAQRAERKGKSKNRKGRNAA